MKKKKKLISSLAVLAAALVFFGGIAFWWSWATQPLDPKATTSQIFVVQKGEGLTSIGDRLDQESLIKSGLAFKVLVSAKGLADQVQAGDFRLKASMSLGETAELLTHGTLDIWLTFPEGWRREEVARRLVANLGGFEEAEFLNLTEGEEGFLFPDTYLIPQEASSAVVLRIFSRNFEAKFDRDLEKAAQKSGLTQDQVLILASIVEREAASDQDRPLIAGILLKRWQNDWPLQADATVQYVKGSLRCQNQAADCDWWRPVSRADLGVDSVYNTYQNKGLPPAPICNPGLASIKAVIYPEKSDDWFYLSDPSGQTHFAQTAEEHVQNIQKYLR